jgi:hypothetical protein
LLIVLSWFWLKGWETRKSPLAGSPAGWEVSLISVADSVQAMTVRRHVGRVMVMTVIAVELHL